MKINIDENAGFCWGVVRTIEIAEKSLDEINSGKIFVLGQIIHNPREMERLEEIGLKTIKREDFKKIAHQKVKVIIRAHGEPPGTYKIAEELGIEIIDATCPLVTRLQNRIKEKYDEGWQIVIFGKKEHAEVIGLRGVCNNKAIVIKNSEEAIKNVDFDKKTVLYSQTTMGKPTFYAIKNVLKEKVSTLIDGSEIKDKFIAKDTICHYVSGREDSLKVFCNENDVVLFVAGRKSSNGRSLYNVCKTVNDRVYFIEDYKEIDFKWFRGASTIGISGATSTPQWYMELVKEKIEEKLS
ncbi:4-hydroxy-3-methylbut-2-enyl diphosphate reductase [Bacteroidota bacterium]